MSPNSNNTELCVRVPCLVQNFELSKRGILFPPQNPSSSLIHLIRFQKQKNQIVLRLFFFVFGIFIHPPESILIFFFFVTSIKRRKSFPGSSIELYIDLNLGLELQ
uniref:Uncharacterized protein n=1 Tax=Nelumbo nucifera TaxID=4432 RepID=A0A822XLB7_NELNU|nr:TPA_asm: hypothetical protein HUJ06_022633 [Nelumbo nucifera]